MAFNILSQYVQPGLKDLVSFSHRKALRFQEAQLKKLLFKAKHTAFGKEHGFEEMLIAPDVYEAFIRRVRPGDYSSMYPWWQRAYAGEADVVWPGKTEFFAMSSGTTEAASKYIPVSKDMLRSIKKTSVRQLMSIVRSDLPKDYLAKHHLMISGSTDLNFNGTSYAGDLSGITTSQIPSWFQRFSRPGMEIRKQRDWYDRLKAMVEEAPKWDVATISGVPAWIKLLLELIIERYQVKHIHEIWPNFSVYIYGGVAIEPYRKSLDALMGKSIMYFETYLASEGFMAYQHRFGANGMRLNFRNGVYYEFIPFTKEHFNEQGELRPDARVLNLADVQEDQEYAILISTCSGAWRYLIGDTIKFTDLEQCAVKITGRTKHFLSICGEHLSVDNMNQAIVRYAERYGVSLPEFTVKGVPFEGFFAHQWYVACDDASINAESMALELDEILCDLNDDYAIERKHALKGIAVELLPSSWFISWMEGRGKLGAQQKFPRVMTDAVYADWISFLSAKKSQNSAH
jgi:hypothetical protein